MRNGALVFSPYHPRELRVHCLFPGSSQGLSKKKIPVDEYLKHKEAPDKADGRLCQGRRSTRAH